MRLLFLVLSIFLASGLFAQDATTKPLKVHGIFRSNMVIQRDKPIKIWGWAKAGSAVEVKFGEVVKTGEAKGEDGLWEVTFDPLAADVNGRELSVKCGEESVKMNNILIGDIWVMNGQSNMGFSLKAVYEKDLESLMANLPLMRHFRIQSGAESEFEEKDIKDKFINGDSDDKNWQVMTPEVALESGAIGYVFGSILQRSLNIPIGIINNSRGGASIESLVPRHQFARDPEAKAYLEFIDQKNKAFDEKAFMAEQMAKYTEAEEKYQKAIAEDAAKGVKTKRKRPDKPEAIRTWSVPGRSPSDAASCYNGMFGVFKGLNIKGVAFHQGFNNTLGANCKPLFYRKLMKLMIDGWRKDFNDEKLPVIIIGFCAGGNAQNIKNFEVEGFSNGAFIREAQRLSLNDVDNKENITYISSDDQQIPQLHTQKKRELGVRAVRWALKEIYGLKQVVWESAKLTSSEVVDGKILLTFDTVVKPDNFSSVIEGFAIAGADGIYYMADAEFAETKDKNSEMKNRQILVSSPLVKEPLTVRYSWATSPMGNLKVNGYPWIPLQNFRTDNFPYTPEVSHLDPEGQKKNGEEVKKLKAQAEAALKKRLETK